MPGAAKEVTLPRRVLDQLTHKMATGADVDASVFADAVSAVAKGLAHDAMRDFVAKHREDKFAEAMWAM